jgi:hypothetical protein
MNGFDKAASYNERFRRSHIRRGIKRIHYQNCMLAVAYGTTVAVFLINSYITVIRCFVANKSTQVGNVNVTMNVCQSQLSEAIFAYR